jgi:hypothetical protein|tara:strand:+ start:380 stop:583 length:204 start_codon:yes stop_codon:yes gene_type:complete
MRSKLLQASKLHFEAHVEKHRINVETMLENPTAIPNHSDIMDAIEKELEEMAKYDDLLEMLDKYFEE